MSKCKNPCKKWLYSTRTHPIFSYQVKKKRENDPYDYFERFASTVKNRQKTLKNGQK